MPLTLEETGRILGITRERVRQIQEKATAKLRNLKELTELKG
ncbi:MAG: RNA polymerase sigma factor RpoD/SigA, partial [Treponema sp.]|jgi:RNA polymerase primary sigma factor|nr:RNA polymerase sigma factor RpoD/SigA [Treponema sp.]